MSSDLYTYRAGKKVYLEKQPDQFVVRAKPEELESMGIGEIEQVSPGSSRVTTPPADLEPLMSRARNVAPTHHAYKTADTGTEFLISDRVLVKFRRPPAPGDLDALVARYALVLLQAYDDRVYLFQLTDHTGMNPVKLVVALNEKEPLVESAEHDLNQRMSKYDITLPSDPFYARQWHLTPRLADPDFDPRACSQCEDAWRLLDGFGSAHVVVGLTDDGCKLDHGDFDSPGKFAGWGYFRGERLITMNDIGADPRQMYKPGANHGTSCAGVIAGEIDAALIVGAAPGCRLLPIQWESSGPSLFISDSKLLTALNYVADKVDVLSNSWGGVPDNTWSIPVIERIAALARNGGRRGRGIVFLWAAGNENCPIQHSGNIDVPYTRGWDFRPDGSQVWVGVQTARRFENNMVGIPGLMHVAALASTAQRSHYSNYGLGIGICAPTNNRHEYLRVAVRGLGIITATGEGGGVTERFGGTSSATPLVAGIAALAISANPQLSALDVLAILKQTASKDLSFDGYPRTPPASYDPNPSWDVSPIPPYAQGAFADIGGTDGTWSPWFGHGRVDAAAAVAEALRRRVPAGQQTLHKESAPALAIPDNDAAGVRDTIRFAEPALLAAIEVSIDIGHTYIGDLVVALRAPSGTLVTLHSRNGGNADDLRRSFDLTSTPALAALIGQAIAGEWTLLVQDLAAIDSGTLNRWAIAATVHAGAALHLDEAPGTMIPDNNPAGIERSLNAAHAGQVRDIEVALDITHTYIGDLSIALVAPSGTSVSLHERAGGPADNLIKTYDLATTPALATLRGQSLQGAWKLKVADLEAADIGKLNRWALRIVYDG